MLRTCVHVGYVGGNYGGGNMFFSVLSVIYLSMLELLIIIPWSNLFLNKRSLLSTDTNRNIKRSVFSLTKGLRSKR